ncbi:PEGA domain-containing protein, partial [Candidatus Saccharibacteria bacterium]|nr:PEGA domain-containing protein [Candidatus Saccharibacteria bacterium]
YRFDLMSGQLSQVALLQFNTFPTGAVVDINGASLSTRTPTRSNIKTGQTKVSMSLTGYRGWSNTVSALPSSVRWLDYARLVPQNVKTESVKTFTNVVDMLPTPDRKWAVVLTNESTVMPLWSTWLIRNRSNLVLSSLAICT